MSIYFCYVTNPELFLERMNQNEPGSPSPFSFFSNKNIRGIWPPPILDPPEIPEFEKEKKRKEKKRKEKKK